MSDSTLRSIPGNIRVIRLLVSVIFFDHYEHNNTDKP